MRPWIVRACRSLHRTITMTDLGSASPVIRTRRLLVRGWSATDARALKDAVDSSLAHLQAWMSWAMSEPSTIEAIEERLAAAEREFAAGRDFAYGLFARETEVLIGGAGLHRRGAPDTMEIGYWVRAGETGRGYATEAAAALTAAGFRDCRSRRIEIRCDPHNVRSAAVPRRLGFRHEHTLPDDTITPLGAPRDTMVWALNAEEFATSPAAGICP